MIWKLQCNRHDKAHQSLVPSQWSKQVDQLTLAARGVVPWDLGLWLYFLLVSGLQFPADFSVGGSAAQWNAIGLHGMHKKVLSPRVHLAANWKRLVKNEINLKGYSWMNTKYDMVKLFGPSGWTLFNLNVLGWRDYRCQHVSNRQNYLL